MRADHNARGAVAVGVLNALSAWEANLILNLRLWCDGPQGQAQVWTEYRSMLDGLTAQRECRAFERLLREVISAAYRPLVRHDVGCVCIGADESVFANLVRAAADGHMRDAALIATLIVGPDQAEDIAQLAAKVGHCARKLASDTSQNPPEHAAHAVLLH